MKSGITSQNKGPHTPTKKVTPEGNEPPGSFFLTIMNIHCQKPLKVSFNKNTTLGEQHTIKEDDDVKLPVAIAFHTMGTLGPEPGRERARKLATSYNACLGLELPPDVKPGVLNRLIETLCSFMDAEPEEDDDYFKVFWEILAEIKR